MRLIGIILSFPFIIVAACLWFPLRCFLRPIVRMLPKRCLVHHTQLVWGFPYGQDPILSGEQPEFHLLRHAFNEEFQNEREKNFPILEFKRDHYALKRIFSLFDKNDPWPYCPECLNAEHKWLKEKQENEEVRKISKMNDHGWVLCPWCSVKFKYHSSCCIGNRHTSCGHKIKLCIET